MREWQINIKLTYEVFPRFLYLDVEEVFEI